MKFIPTLLFVAFSLCYSINSLHNLDQIYKTENVAIPVSKMVTKTHEDQADVKINSNRDNNTVTITTSSDLSAIKIEVYNLLGKKLAQDILRFQDKKAQFSTHDLSSGVYILVTTTPSGKRRSFKFVK